jgi:hypothetical protein
MEDRRGKQAKPRGKTRHQNRSHLADTGANNGVLDAVLVCFGAADSCHKDQPANSCNAVENATHGLPSGHHDYRQ